MKVGQQVWTAPQLCQVFSNIRQKIKGSLQEFLPIDTRRLFTLSSLLGSWFSMIWFFLLKWSCSILKVFEAKSEINFQQKRQVMVWAKFTKLGITSNNNDLLQQYINIWHGTWIQLCQSKKYYVKKTLIKAVQNTGKFWWVVLPHLTASPLNATSLLRAIQRVWCRSLLLPDTRVFLAAASARPSSSSIHGRRWAPSRRVNWGSRRDWPNFRKSCSRSSSLHFWKYLFLYLQIFANQKFYCFENSHFCPLLFI